MSVFFYWPIFLNLQLVKKEIAIHEKCSRSVRFRAIGESVEQFQIQTFLLQIYTAVTSLALTVKQPWRNFTFFEYFLGIFCNT